MNLANLQEKPVNAQASVANACPGFHSPQNAGNTGEMAYRATIPPGYRRLLARLTKTQIRTLERRVYWELHSLPYRLGLRRFEPICTPIIINNRNRLHCLRELLDFLEKAGLTHIFILDNDSSYPPFLEFYTKVRYPVIFLRRNLGSEALWLSPLFRQFRSKYYVYTDPDILPCVDCPQDFLQHFHDVLQQHARVGKVGFGLKTDDLPTHYALRAQVISWENQFWQKPVAPGLYDANIDTTFALYRPGARGGHWCPALRTGEPYVARHLPWYVNTSQPPEEELYYWKTSRHGTWTRTTRQLLKGDRPTRPMD